MPPVRWFGRSIVAILACLLPLGAAACGAVAAVPPAVPAATQPPASVSPSATPLAATTEAGDTDASSMAHQENPPDTVRQSNIATLQLLSTPDRRALTVRVDDVRDLYAVDMELHFDPARVQVADADPSTDGVQIQPGKSPRPDFVAINTADNQRGIIRYVATQLGDDESAFSGGGIVATIHWQAPADPDVTLRVVGATLVSSEAQAIDAAVKR